MESLINSALNQRRRSISPFCFVNNFRSLTITPVCFMSYFMSLMHINDQQERKILKQLVFENHLLDMHDDARFTQFRPSIIALVGIIAEREDGLGDFWDHVFGSEFVDLNDLDQIESCLNLLDMIRAEKIVEAAVEPKIVGMWAETLRSWPDDEVAVAGELSNRVQQLRRSSRRI